MRRIFIAVKIEPEEELLKMISSFKLALKNDRIKWTETSNIHITLVFIGDTEEKRVRETDILLSELCNGFGNFELVLRGSGIFRSLNDPRVIWAGIDNSEQMSRLNKLITNILQETGTVLEDRPFRPHLTLGRVKKINDLTKFKALFDEFKNQEIQRVKVTEIILYESMLRPEGPLYKPVGRYLLD